MSIQMDIHEIIELLPHRYPFLLIDRVLSMEPDKSIVALKNVTINEPFFPGHYPHHPVMPGVLIIEAMAQASALLSFKSMKARPTENPNEKSVYYFAGIDGARFRQPVGPGDQLIIKATLVRSMRGLFKFSATAEVDGKLAAEAELMCTVKAVS
ncbi:MAG: 3-hydroxyacyl-[acyl-carrier-protein] dehydratase FabZ [Gallionellales bacterium RIFCSPLOWO2_02_FULL_57_47]|jgi:3-hydroxyacyl-[acyl-carrier-protein] dehydratase|nr:MAG: 3-hydroxyacyl-[acyl-carrier-protein] dehydratase FabZ [Gallionellales bacterium RIFCSPLOWO2_02_FULL_57_47]OGT17192.1 MAG: 3-hydroxyacyl-[acyl-carrier-protein] dehydratase FabZ [Gallionellales bacterium RIFCSPHIGHO2_02_FULL_57_16]